MAIYINCIGNLGNHAEIQKTKNGNMVKFSVAVKRYVNGNESTDWLNCADFRGNDLNTNVAKYLAKGKNVSIRGRLETQSKEKSDSNGVVSKITYYSVIIDSLDLLRNKEDLGVNPKWSTFFGGTQTPPPQAPQTQEKVYFVGDASTQLPLSQLGGKVAPDTQVWAAGMASWLPASQVPELSHLFVAPPPQGPSQTPPPMDEINDENPF
tara:strand:- start:75 stop:701 length:627 start_codon:yes stop_codon:yes gene_type:complete